MESSVWTKKNKEFKGKNYYYSLKNKLEKENKINQEFNILYIDSGMLRLFTAV